MKLKRGLLAAVGAFGVLVISDYVIHEFWLGAFYRATAAWWRPAEQMRQLMGFMFAGELALALLLTIVYAKGYERGKGTVTQGFRFGVLMGLLLFVPSSLMQYVVSLYPLGLLLNWLLGGLLQITLTGMLIGWVYKEAGKAKST